MAEYERALAATKRDRERIKAEHAAQVEAMHNALRAQHEANVEHHRAQIERIEREREEMTAEHERIRAKRASIEDASRAHHDEWVAHLTQSHEEHLALVERENEAREGWYRAATEKLRAALSKSKGSRKHIVKALKIVGPGDVEIEYEVAPGSPPPDPDHDHVEAEKPPRLEAADGPVLPDPPGPLPEIPGPVLPEIPDPPVELVLPEIPGAVLPPLPEPPEDPGEEPPVYIARPVECGEEPWEMVETRWGTVRALDGSFVLEGPDGIHIVGEAELDRDYVRC